jgi:hypothetical protein
LWQTWLSGRVIARAQPFGKLGVEDGQKPGAAHEDGAEVELSLPGRLPELDAALAANVAAPAGLDA